MRHSIDDVLPPSIYCASSKSHSSSNFTSIHPCIHQPLSHLPAPPTFIGDEKVWPHHAGASWSSLASSPPENQVQTGYDSLEVPAWISADIPGWRLSGNLRHRRQETSSVRSHWDAICTQDNDHAGDEKFHGCWPSHLEQFTSRSANCNSLPSDVRSTSEGPPVWLIGSASEDYLWCALQIPSSSSSSYLLWLLRLNVLLLVWHLEEHNMAVEYSTPVILQKVSLEIFEDIA